MTVEIDGLVRRFGSSAALDGVSLSLRPGEFAALLGPSGSGKTTLLRILAGLDFPDSGRVRIAGEDVADIPARLRGVGVVFQHYALFRHMTVADNVAFGLRVRPRRTRPAEAEIARRVAELLELVQIPELARRYPGQVSGGQRQRVALARALAIEPQLLLLDEPFGALDALVRKDVRRWVRGLHDRLGITSILVTHDQEEAMELADRIAVMNHGRILQFGTPRELLDAPQNAFVAGFVGDANSLDGVVRDGRLEIPGLGIPPREVGWPDGPVRIFVRPEDVAAVPAPAAQGPLRVALLREERGGTRLVLQGEGLSLDAILQDGATRIARGDACTIRLRHLVGFSGDGAVRLVDRPMEAVS